MVPFTGELCICKRGGKQDCDKHAWIDSWHSDSEVGVSGVLNSMLKFSRLSVHDRPMKLKWRTNQESVNSTTESLTARALFAFGEA